MLPRPFRRLLRIFPIPVLRCLLHSCILRRRGGVGHRVIIWMTKMKTMTMRMLLLLVLARSCGGKGMRCLDTVGLAERRDHLDNWCVFHADKKSETRSRADREADNHQLLQLEEKDVVSSVATVLSDLCGPGEWMPMAKLHAELVEQYGNIWHHSRVRRYLTSEDWPATESKGRPWFGLLTLLRKYPEHFVINTRSKGRVTSEFVSLVSLLS
uniref:FHA domain-containing protein FHA2-like n=1 Tax=Nelumbo nucifera TaxID=4432 RepID=A0A822XXU1_NELNU|nr:TPA_asm: hypothetical protein HUJ06_025484 [Nelumbo nucifera]